MGGKSCGTCESYVPFPQSKGNGLCYKSIDDDYQLFVKADDVCYGAGLYRERIDSLEHVAVEMLRELSHTSALIDVERWSDSVYDKYHLYRDRLKAFGVSVDD